MKNGHRVVDADGHIVEPADLWDRYIDKEFYGVRPVCDPNSGAIEVVGHQMSRHYEQESRTGVKLSYHNPEAAARGYDAPSQIDAMDAEGIDVMVLFPSRGLYCVAVADLDGRISSAITRAYNRWIVDFASADPARLLPACIVGLHDPQRAVADVHYAAELGARAIMIRPNPCFGRPLHAPEHDDFFAAIAEVGIPLATHEGSGVYMPEFGPDRFAEHAFWHVMAHPMEQMVAVLSLTLGGVLERHPDLRVAILEAGSSWLPSWLHRIDEHSEWLGAPGGELAMLPSERFRRQCFISCEPDEPGLRALVDFVGMERLLWASDYPHPDGTYPGAVEEIAKCPDFSDAELRQLLDENPTGLYAI